MVFFADIQREGEYKMKRYAAIDAWGSYKMDNKPVKTNNNSHGYLHNCGESGC